MPSFVYTARDGSGTAVTGTMVADSIAEVSRMLRGDGKYPTQVAPAEDATPRRQATAGGIRISRADVIQISTQLSVMVETGVTLSEALECISEQADKPQLKALMQDLSQQVQAGGDFSAALSRHPRSFPRIFVALIKASERTGMLGRMLTRATSYLRDEQETIQKVKGAVTYPAIMLGFAVTTTVFLLAFVMPKFTAIYASKGAALPGPTRVLMGLSDFLVAHYVAVPLGTLACVGGLILYLRSPDGSRMWHYVQLRLPILGGVFRKLHLSRGLRTVGTMAGSGVSLVDCVGVAHDLCPNSYYREMWEEVGRQIQAGRQLSEPLLASPLVPKPVSQMLRSAEKSGKLAIVMEQVAGFSEQELKEKIVEVTRYIEPAMILIMGVIIGGVTLALMLPIFSISRVVAK